MKYTNLFLKLSVLWVIQIGYSATEAPIKQAPSSCTLNYNRSFTFRDPREGFRFGACKDSRIEYAELPDGQSEELHLTVTLRTLDKNGGLIFYVTTDQAAERPEQFLALYMKDGKIYFSYNCGGSTVVIVSQNSYIDEEWHTVTASRTNSYNKLTIDNQTVNEANVSCDNPVPLAAPYYYGGLKSTDSAKTHLGDIYQPFNGCLRTLILNGQHIPERQRLHVLRCSDNVEEGVYFGPSTNTTSNYLKLKESGFRVSISISISMDIKPRNSTGLLLAAHGKKDYLVLELLENEVVVHVENGRGEFRASHKLAEPKTMCDGNWHHIMVLKARHVVSVGIDKEFGNVGVGIVPSTDTRSALYIGGHEKIIARLRGARSKQGFNGCIKNIMIREQPVEIPLSAAYGDTHIGACLGRSPSQMTT